MRIRHLVMVVTLLIVFVSCNVTATEMTLETPKNRTQSWQEDIAFLADTLPKAHVNLFFALPEEVFRSRLHALSQKVGNLTDLQIYIELAETIALVKDSHTQIRPNISTCALPIKFMEFADGIYPVAWAVKYGDLTGANLVAINNMSINDVYKRLSNLIPYDNQAQLRQNVPNLLSNYDLLIATGIVADDGVVRYWFRTPSGQQKQVDVAIEPVNSLQFTQVYNTKTDPTPLYLSRQDWFWYKSLADRQTLYIQYNVCWDKETEKQFNPSSTRLAQLPDFSTFAEGVLASVRSEPLKAIIVDLRLNTGGNSALGTRFFQALAKELQSRSRINVYGIIGNRTFSSAIINAIDLKNIFNAPLYGEATAGKPNHYGEVRTFQLPNSKWTVQYSTKYFRFATGDSDSLYPDINVEPTFGDFVSGHDPVLERLLLDIAAQ